MSDKHTQEPWVIGRDDRPGMEWNNHILSGKNPNIAICFMTHDGTDDNEGGEANARRIVACVNACAGISNEVLEKYAALMPAVEHCKSLEKQRDEMLAALEHVVSAWSEQFERYGHMAPDWAKHALAAIASVKEES